MTTATVSPPNRQPKRIELEARIVRRLQRLDYDLLQQLDVATQQAERMAQERFAVQSTQRAVESASTHGEHTAEPATASFQSEYAAEPAVRPTVTRRQMFTRLVAGGTVLAAAGYAVTRPDPLGLTPETESGSVVEEMATLQILLDLYEMMDRVGLDRLLLTVLTAMGVSVEGLRVGATALRAAVDFIAGMIDRFESVVPQILAGIEAAEGFLQTIERHIDELERLIGDALQEAAPLTQAVDRFVQKLLSYLPFGIGERIQEAAQAMAAVVGLLPMGVRVLRDQLFSPMRAWFPSDDAADMRAMLFTPTRRDLLDPARTLIDDLIGFATRWDEELSGPIGEALAQRDEVRTQIAEYKERSLASDGKGLL